MRRATPGSPDEDRARREHGNAYNIFILILTLVLARDHGPPAAAAERGDAPPAPGLRQRDLRDLPRRLPVQPDRLAAEARRTSSASAAGSTCWARSRRSGTSSSRPCSASRGSAGWHGSPGCMGGQNRKALDRGRRPEPRPVRDLHHAPVRGARPRRPRASSSSTPRAGRPTRTSRTAGTPCGGGS